MNQTLDLKSDLSVAALSAAAPEVSFLASCIHPHLKVLGGGRCRICFLVAFVVLLFLEGQTLN